MENNEIMMDEMTEVISESPRVDVKKLGIGVLAVGAVVALGVAGYKLVKAKMDAKKAAENEVIGIGDSEDMEADD